MRPLHVSSKPGCLVVTLCCLALAACAGPAPVPPERVIAEEARLFQPFTSPMVVVGDEVEVTVSPNFFNRIGQPALDPQLHTRSHTREGGGEEFRFANPRGGVQRPLRLLIGDVQYQALRIASVRVLPSGTEMTLNVVARGDVSVIANGKRRDMPAMEIRDGLWRDR